MAKAKTKNTTEVSNDAGVVIEQGAPYRIEVTLSGVSDMLFHRWSCDDVEAKAKAAKNSSAKKTDNIDSYVYRDEKGHIALPGEYVRQSIIMAAKYRQDPRSPRKSAMDMYKAGIVSLTDLASLGTKQWDYEDRRRVVIQRSGITRVRPAMKAGWEAKVVFQVLLGEYISPNDFVSVLNDAGRLVGLADFRPTYGRFVVKSFDVLKD